MSNTQPSLWNSTVLLRPIAEQDIEAFSDIAFDNRIWQYFVTNAGDQEGIRKFVLIALRDMANGSRMPYTVIDRHSGKVAGSMSFSNHSVADSRIEIGWSWLGVLFQGTVINSNAKYLLMKYAFEILQSQRVEFKTDVLNLRARAALKKIGAQEEGVLRSHTLMPGGRRRNTIYYSVLSDEWSNVAALLTAKGVCTKEWGYSHDADEPPGN